MRSGHCVHVLWFCSRTESAWPEPVSEAIYNAIAHQKGEALFFAAAGNDGANLGREMFPASHRNVISVYGTDANGAFLESVNPPTQQDVYGTLAEKIPCSGLSKEGEVFETGTSFATAIAAGWEHRF